MSGDPYVYPGTDVLRNVWGLRDRDELSRLEAGLGTVAMARLALDPLPSGYDLVHLQAFAAGPPRPPAARPLRPRGPFASYPECE